MPITDAYSHMSSGLSSPAVGAFAITPNDGSDLALMPRALMVATAGDVSVVMKDGSPATLPALMPGVVYPLRVKRVLATGTGAGGIVGLY